MCIHFFSTQGNNSFFLVTYLARTADRYNRRLGNPFQLKTTQRPTWRSPNRIVYIGDGRNFPRGRWFLFYCVYHSPNTLAAAASPLTRRAGDAREADGPVPRDEMVGIGACAGRPSGNRVQEILVARLVEEGEVQLEIEPVIRAGAARRNHPAPENVGDLRAELGGGAAVRGDVEGDAARSGAVLQQRVAAPTRDSPCVGLQRAPLVGRGDRPQEGRGRRGRRARERRGRVEPWRPHIVRKVAGTGLEVERLLNVRNPRRVVPEQHA